MFAGRLVAGIGAVLLNVLLTKMVTDWFMPAPAENSSSTARRLSQASSPSVQAGATGENVWDAVKAWVAV